MYTVLVIRRRGWNDWQVGGKGRSTQAGFLPKVDELNTLDSPARSIPQWPARRRTGEREEGRRQEIRTTLVLALALAVEVGSDRWMVRESGRRAMNRRLVLAFFRRLLFQLATASASAILLFSPLVRFLFLFWTCFRTIVFPCL